MVNDTAGGAGFKIYRASDAPGLMESGCMTMAPMSEVQRDGLKKLVEAGYLLGDEVKILVDLPGFSLAHAWLKKDYPLTLHSHDSDCLYYVISGSLKFGTEELGPRDCIFVPANVPYTYRPGPSGVEVLEFRHAPSFNFVNHSKSAAYWAKAAEIVAANVEEWKVAKRPALNVSRTTFMELDWLTRGPRPVTDIEEGLEGLVEHGACTITGALDSALLQNLQSAVYRAASSDRKYGWAQAYQYGKDDHINQRIWNLPSHDPVFCELAEHPLAIEVVKRTLGWPASLSSMSANITNGGGASMLLHTDQGYLPGPLSQAWVYNLVWCLDEFTAENGATLIAPGSHRLNGARLSEEALAKMRAVEAPAGSLIVLDGRLWHTNGVNTCGTSRAGVFAVYTLPWLMPQENWSLSINPAIRQFGSETLQTLFGFRPQVLGRVNGMERI